jgi:EAL domain-containing protein (putative c-di-GMP-specific phosphodiesterase class I)/CheY-like chemotaxis protein
VDLDAAGAASLASRVRSYRTAPEQVLVLSRDPAVISAASDAVRHRGAAPTLTRTGREALARLAAPGLGPHHLLADPAAAGASWPHLLATLAEPSARTTLVVVSTNHATLPRGMGAIPAEAGPLAEAMSHERPGPAGKSGGKIASLPNAAAADLAAGLTRGEIVLRYQPVVRMRDRRPVMVEALARWQRNAAPIPPDAFMPLAERSGLARALSIVVASRAGVELGRLHDELKIGVSINLPLAMLLQADLVSWLHKALRHSGLRPAKVSLELTETTEVRDVSTLRRALLRLRAGGYRVLLDDIILNDERERFFHLPFAGFKLDRSLVMSLPEDARARHEVRRITRDAHRRGQLIIAEGVSDLRLWAVTRGIGIDHAQGFIVGRPLPAEALSAWWASWRSRQPA